MNNAVVVYARVSTEGQEKEETIETQLMVVRDKCRAMGWGIVDEYKDEGVSGTVPFDERPQGRRFWTRPTMGYSPTSSCTT